MAARKKGRPGSRRVRPLPGQAARRNGRVVPPRQGACRYPPLRDPNLIFKVEPYEAVHDEAFRRPLAGADIKTAASAPARSGYWIALTDDPGFARLCKKLDERATAEKAGLCGPVARHP